MNNSCVEEQSEFHREEAIQSLRTKTAFHAAKKGLRGQGYLSVSQDLTFCDVLVGCFAPLEAVPIIGSLEIMGHRFASWPGRVFWKILEHRTVLDCIGAEICAENFRYSLDCA